MQPAQHAHQNKRAPVRPARFALRPVAYCVALACCELAAANPTGPQVVQGNVQFQGLGSNRLTVTNSPGSIIHWQGFSIGAGQVTQFAQQSATSSVMNRVVGADISQIHGQLLSNGRVFLINPAGIVIGAGAVIDTAGFVGSTLRMQDADFLAGKLRFQGDASSGAIRNEGTIVARHGGDVVLVAPQIENGASGLVRSEGGDIVLAAGQKLTVGSTRLEGVQFEVQAPADSAVNVGQLIADGGAVGVFAGTLRHSGDIRANALARDDAGRIVLKAKEDVTLTASSTTQANGAKGGAITVQSGSGTTLVSGRIEAKGDAGQGGEVRVLGERAGVVGRAVIDASGETGGGQILVGGDYQGRNPDVQNASRALVGPNATLRADAGASGNGGKVIVWADGDTRFDGTISARGGASAGDGGFVETSGKESLSVGDARVDAGAPAGRSGTWLLDPKFIIVQIGGVATLVQVDEFGDGPPPPDTFTIAPATIAGAGADVVLQANTDITFASDFSTPNNRSFTAQAGRSIVFNPGVTLTATNSTGVFLTANETAAAGVVATQRDPGAGDILMSPGSRIAQTGTGDVVLRMNAGLGDPTKTSGSIFVERIESGNEINVIHNGPTPGGSILRPPGSANHVLQASDAVNLQIVNAAAAPSPGSIGASGAPIVTSAPLLEAYTQVASGGIFLDSQFGGQVTIGGSLINPPAVKGVQTVSGGPIEITSVGAITQQAGGACGPGGAGGPICAGPAAGAASALDPANTVTLRGTDVVLTSTTRGREVNLLPPAGGAIRLGTGGRVGFTVAQTDIDQVQAGLLRIGEDASGAVSFVSTPAALDVPVTRAATLEIRSGSTILGDPAGAAGNDLSVAGPLTLSGTSIGAQTGLDDLFITPGSTVSATATTGDIFIRHITSPAGRLRLSDYTTLSVAAGQSARLTHAGPGNAIPTLDRNVDMPGRTLTLAGFGTTTTVEVEGSPTVNAGQVNFNGSANFYNGGGAGTATFNAPLTITNAATFSGGTTLFNQAATVQNAGAAAAALTLAAGTIAGSNTLTVNGNATWSGGGMSGTGTTDITGALTMNGGAKSFEQRTLTVAGASTWTAGNVTNVDGGTFNANGGLTISDALQWTGAGAATKINVPIGQTLTRNGAAGTVTLERATIDNFGGVTLGANTGEFRLSNGAGAATGNLGAVAVGAGSTLNFAGGTYGSIGAVSGAGAVTVSGGDVSFGGTFSNTNTLNVSGGLARFQVVTAPSPGTVNVSGGTLLVAVPMTFGGGTLSNGTLSVANAGNTLTLTSGGFDWSGGTLTGGGTFIVNPGAQLDVTGAAATHTMSTSAQIRNDGIMTWVGTLQGTNGTNLITNNNRLDVLGDATLSRAGPGTIEIVNSFGANFNKNVSGTLTFDTNAAFRNNGTVTVGAGVMNLNGGGRHAGTFNANTFLTFGGGLHTLTGTSNIAGTGNVSFTAGEVNVGGAFDLNNAAGSAGISGGTVNFNGATAADFGSLLTMTGGTLAGTGAVTHPGTFNWSGGTLAGTGAKTFNGQMNWSGGTLSAPSVAAGPLVINPTVANAVTIDGATLQHTSNAGTSDWRGAADLRIVNNGVFQNEGNFRLNLGAGSANIVGDGTGIFRNQSAAATLLKQGAGTVNIGTAGNTVLFVNNGTTTVAAGTLGINGNATQAGTFDVTGGVLDFTGGAQVFAAGSRLQGVGITRFSGGAHTVQNGAAVPDANLSVTGGTLTYDAAVTTPGSLAVSGGTADFNAAVAIAGAATFSGGTTTCDAAGNTIAGATAVSGGSVGGAGSTTANGGLTFTGGTVAGTLSVPGTTTVNAGAPQITGTLTAGTLALSAGGALTIAAGGTLTSGAGPHTLNGATLANNGTLNMNGTWNLTNAATLTNNNTATWTGAAGGISLANGTTLTNGAAGTFNLNPTATGLGVTGAGTFTNTGVLNANAPAGMDTLIASTFDNGNTVNVDGGTLVLTGGGTHGGNFAVDPGTTLRFGGGNHTVSTASGAGNLDVTAGGVTVNGAVTNTGTFSISGGTATFAANGTAYAPNAITVSGGTATFNRVVNDAGALTLSGGIAEFAQASTAAGASAVSGGTLQGAGALTIANDLALSGGTLAGTLTVDGTTTVSGGTPQITGTLDTDVFNMTGGTLGLAGTLAASANAPSTVSGGILNNTGTLRVAGGNTLTFGGAATLNNNGGTLNAQAGSLVYNATQNFNNGTSFTGVTGGNRVTSGSTFSDAITSANLSLGGGTYGGTATFDGTTTWQSGTIAGTYTLANTGTFNVTGSGVFSNPTTFLNNGTFNIQPGGSIQLFDNGATFSTFDNRGTLNVNATGFPIFSRPAATQNGNVLNSGIVNVNTGASFEARFTNSPGATLNVNNAGTTLSMQNGQTLQGTIALNDPSATLWVSEIHGAPAAFNGTTINGNGTVLVMGGGFSPVATFSNVTASNATLSVGNNGTANVTGATSFGNLIVNGGTLGGNAALGIGGNLTFSSGTISDTGGVSVAGTSTWTGGTITGNFTVPAAATLNVNAAGLAQAGTMTVNGTLAVANSAGLTNNGTMSVGGAGAVTIGTGATLTNAAGRTLNLTALANNTGFTGAGTLRNDGTLNVNAGSVDTTLIATTFNNAGTTNIDGGTLRLTGGGTHAGDFAADAGTTLVFGGGTHTVATASGAGSLMVTAGAMTANGAVANTGGLTVSGGAATFAANATAYAPGSILVSGGSATFSRVVNDGGGLTVSGGAVQFDQASSVAGASALSGGTLQGAGALTINNALGVSGGTIAGNLTVTGTTTVTGGTPNVTGTLNVGALSMTGGTTTVAGGGTLNASGAAAKTMNAAALVNNGTFALTGNGGLTLQNGATITNNNLMTWAGATTSLALNAGTTLTNSAGGTLNLNGTVSGTGVSGPGALANAGILNVNAPGLVTVVGAPLTNGGTVNVDGGTLRLTGGGTDTGTFALDPGTTLDFAGGTYGLNAGAAVTGGGNVLVSGGTLDVNSALTIPNPFTLTGNAAALGGAGNATLTGAFTWSQGADIAGTGSLTTSGVTTLSDAGAGIGKNWTNAAGGTVNMGPGAALEFVNTASTFTNQGTFNLASTGATPISVASGSGAVVNQGTFNKAGAGTQSILTTTFTNAAGGALNVSAGTLAIPSLNANAGVITLSNGAVLTTNGANGINNTGTLQGIGTFNVGAGNAVLNNGVVSPGASPGTMTIVGDYTQGPLGTLLVELGGTQQGVTYDLLQVTGTANLGGTTVVSLVNGFVPQSTDTFTFMTYSSRNGDFATVTLPPAGSLQPFPGTSTYRVAFPLLVFDDAAAREVRRLEERLYVITTEDGDELELPRGALECR